MLGNINARSQPMTIGQLAGSRNDFFNPFGGSMDMSLAPAQGIAQLYATLGGTLGQLGQGWESLLNGPSLLEEMGGLKGLLGPGDPTAGVPGLTYGIPGLTPGMPGQGPAFGNPGGNGYGLSIPPLMNLGGIETFLNMAGTRVSDPATSAATRAPAPPPPAPRAFAARVMASRFGRGAQDLR